MEPMGLDELEFVSLNRNNIVANRIEREGGEANKILHMVIGHNIIVEDYVYE